ncbi:cytochrome c3 family protein [Inmirania thermothiophila]|uniref:Putative CXXCH cytochrome family protein n=1 Tax=Inmirania thermothiophila TaxID=1750597 RepID=A0A3N1Y6Y2_9GAMM|nr:cytochrome c3 family protein [Inmirania thermothiophila]ROR34510.1 putative CXXCH cytochrome family protein [Inmirania thermothiophila]
MWRSERRPVPLVWAAPVVLLAAVLLASRPEGAAAPTHPDTVCAGCHLAGPRTRPETARFLVASEERLCGGCHAAALRASHPTGVRPVRPLPAAYPTDWKGELTCSTCHDVHAAGPGKLRGERRGRGFCLSCHEQAFFDAMPEGGTALMVSGHLADDGPPAGRIDRYSAQCLGCHADKLGLKEVRIDVRGVLRHPERALNHPIGVRYADAEAYGGYRPAALLPREMLLPGGRLSCLSCHRAYEARHGALVRRYDNGELCYQCHDL